MTEHVTHQTMFKIATGTHLIEKQMEFFQKANKTVENEITKTIEENISIKITKRNFASVKKKKCSN